MDFFNIKFIIFKMSNLGLKLYFSYLESDNSLYLLKKCIV